MYGALYKDQSIWPLDLLINRPKFVKAQLKLFSSATHAGTDKNLFLHCVHLHSSLEKQNLILM